MMMDNVKEDNSSQGTSDDAFGLFAEAMKDFVRKWSITTLWVLKLPVKHGL